MTLAPPKATGSTMCLEPPRRPVIVRSLREKEMPRSWWAGQTWGCAKPVKEDTGRIPTLSLQAPFRH